MEVSGERTSWEMLANSSFRPSSSHWDCSTEARSRSAISLNASQTGWNSSRCACAIRWSRLPSRIWRTPSAKVVKGSEMCRNGTGR